MIVPPNFFNAQVLALTHVRSKTFKPRRAMEVPNRLPAASPPSRRSTHTAPHTARHAPSEPPVRHYMAHAPPPLARAPHKQEQVSSPSSSEIFPVSNLQTKRIFSRRNRVVHVELSRTVLRSPRPNSPSVTQIAGLEDRPPGFQVGSNSWA